MRRKTIDDRSRLMQARGDAAKWADCMSIWTYAGNRQRFDICAARFDEAAAIVAQLEERLPDEETGRKWSAL